MLVAVVYLDSGAVKISNVPYQVSDEQSLPGLISVSDISYVMRSDRNFELGTFQVTFDNSEYYWDDVLAGADKNIIGKSILIYNLEGDQDLSDMDLLAVGLIRGIVPSDPLYFTVECSFDITMLEIDRGQPILKSVFPNCDNEAEGQFMAQWARGNCDHSDILAGSDGFGQIKAWRCDTNLFLVGMCGSDSPSLVKAWAKDGTVITGSCSLTTGTYDSVDYDLVSYTSTDPYIWINYTINCSLATIIRINSTNYTYDNMNTAGEFNNWDGYFDNMGYADTKLLFNIQKSIPNYDFLINVMQCFDLWTCPKVGDATTQKEFLQLQESAYHFDPDDYSATAINWSTMNNFSQRIDMDNVWAKLTARYWYHHGMQQYRRSQSGWELPTDWEPNNIDRWIYLDYVSSWAIAAKLALRWLFFYNKPHFYYSFTIDYNKAKSLRCGSYVSINYPLGYFKNTDRICMITSYIVRPMSHDVLIECLDYSYITSKLKDIKLMLISNGPNGNGVLVDCSPLGQHIPNNIGGLTHVTANYKYNRSSLYFDGTNNQITVPDSTDWDVSNNTNFTITFWIRRAAASGAYEIPIGQNESATIYWGIGIDTANKFYFVHRPPAGIAASMTAAAATADTNWHHIALCKVGTDWGLYIDGAIAAYMSDGQTGVYAAVLRIGAWDAANAYIFSGNMDELVISHDNFFDAAPDAGLTDTITAPADKMTWEG